MTSQSQEEQFLFLYNIDIGLYGATYFIETMLNYEISSTKTTIFSGDIKGRRYIPLDPSSNSTSKRIDR